MAAESDYDVLLSDLYAGIADPDRMARFLRRLCDSTGSHTGLLLRQDFADNSVEVPHIVGCGAAEALEYEAQYAADNIWFQRSLPYIRTGSVHFSDDHVPKREFQRTRYYQDFLRLLDVSHSLGVCGLREQEQVAFLTLCRSEGNGAYEVGERELVQRIAAHWVNAHALLRQTELMQRQVALLGRAQRGVFLLDADFRWRQANDSAEAMVANGWFHGKACGALTPASGATRAAWQDAQRQVGAGGRQGRACAFPVHARDGRLVALASLRPLGAACAGRDMPEYVLFVAPMQPDLPAVLAHHLQRMFGLTASEAGLCIALHAHGEVSLAAAALGISAGTARTRLQAIFDKTGIHRQIDLHRLLDVLAENAS